MEVIKHMPARYDEVIDQMGKYVHTITEDPTLISPAPAFVLIRDAFVGDIYKIFVNSADKDLEKFLLMHECGHIIFNHVDNTEKKTLGVASRIRSRFEQYKEWFDNEDSFFEYFKSYLFNVVEDFEVNSKLFTRDEFEGFCVRLQSLLNDSNARGMWPEDYGYPIGKTWREYLAYILDNLEPFLQKTKDKMDSDSANSTKEKSKSSNSKSTKQEKTKKHPGFSKEQLQKIKDDFESKKSSSLEKTAKKIEDRETFGENDGFSETYGDSSHVTEITEITPEKHVTFEDLNKIFEKTVFKKTSSQSRRDQMYNVNRRKLGNSTLIVPRNVSRQEFRPDNFYVLLDVSGSIDTNFSKKVVSFFNEFGKKYGKDSRLIMWDSKLCLDKKLKDIGTEVVYGGDNNLADGITYIEKNYVKGKSDVKCFLISDFYDDLPKMRKSLRKGKATWYAINWHGDGDFLKTILPDWKIDYKDVWNLNY